MNYLFVLFCAFVAYPFSFFGFLYVILRGFLVGGELDSIRTWYRLHYIFDHWYYVILSVSFSCVFVNRLLLSCIFTASHGIFFLCAMGLAIFPVQEPRGISRMIHVASFGSKDIWMKEQRIGDFCALMYAFAYIVNVYNMEYEFSEKHRILLTLFVGGSTTSFFWCLLKIRAPGSRIQRQMGRITARRFLRVWAEYTFIFASLYLEWSICGALLVSRIN